MAQFLVAVASKISRSRSRGNENPSFMVVKVEADVEGWLCDAIDPRYSPLLPPQSPGQFRLVKSIQARFFSLERHLLDALIVMDVDDRTSYSQRSRVILRVTGLFRFRDGSPHLCQPLDDQGIVSFRVIVLF
ncbi:hypothetical protein B0H19DRAFT_1082063 [Mycena capillaripes]|nr:hypothetical protein B0H19DRAFT_1082063 [Mycena capillaripes]